MGSSKPLGHKGFEQILLWSRFQGKNDPEKGRGGRYPLESGVIY